MRFCRSAGLRAQMVNTSRTQAAAAAQQQQQEQQSLAQPGRGGELQELSPRPRHQVFDGPALLAPSCERASAFRGFSSMKEKQLPPPGDLLDRSVELLHPWV